MKAHAISWINAHRTIGHVAVLILLLVAMIGPWAATSGGVPPAAWYRQPNVLLEDGRCVRLLPGAEILAFMTRAFFSMSVGLATGETVLPDRAREFLATFLFVMYLLAPPYLSTLLLIRGEHRRPRRVSHATAWWLAALFSGLIAVAQPGSGRRPGLWGIWLCVGSAASALALDFVALRAGRPAASCTWPTTSCPPSS